MESNSQNIPAEVPFSLQKPPKSNTDCDCVQEREVQYSINQNETDEQENSSQVIFSNASYPDEIARGINISPPTTVPSQGLNSQSDEEGNDSQSETSSCSHSSQETTSSSDSSSVDGMESSPMESQMTSLLEMYIRDYDIDPSETSDYSDEEQESSQISNQSSISISSSVSSNRCIFLFDPMNDDDDDANASMMSLDYEYFDLD
ncbi:predicted protein [Chaetoceros tenuissimus]|uniref:Uncharacterized protein n=1 Tax=Chaetoceros tenuissimus TaxID=426638 RepID=A0AAD3H612_9STRA|nr:predicted protein [Chaetoceros tenuissimus]